MCVCFDAGYPPAVHADNAVGHRGQGSVVGDDQCGNVRRAAGVLQQLKNLFAGAVIEGSCGLVAQEELGVFRERSGDGNALLLAAGKLGGEVVEALFQPNTAERFGGIEGIGADLRSKLNIFKRRKVGN